MDLNPYVESLRRELATAAEVGGDEAWALAERLTAPLEASVRLALLHALSAAADEITRDLAPGSVELRLRGGEPSFAVTAPQMDDERDDDDPRPALPPVPAEADDGEVARVNLRLPESLKARVDAAAAEAGLSVNAWLVRAVGAALNPDSTSRRSARMARAGAQHYEGWVR
jgi:hypothetical protein